ncbi:unnamed protein product [Urochloa humidicola]
MGMTSGKVEVPQANKLWHAVDPCAGEEALRDEAHAFEFSRGCHRRCQDHGDEDAERWVYEGRTQMSSAKKR